MSDAQPRIMFTQDFCDVLRKQICDEKVLLVTSNGFEERGEVARVRRSLPVGSLEVFSGVLPNPDVRDLQSTVNLYKEAKISTVVGLGGGSALDTAKILSVWLANPKNSFQDIVTREASAAGNEVPIITVPTTAGTGAEVTPFATAWDMQLKKKYSVSGVRPKVAILDAGLTVSLGHENTLYPGLDAMSHALESLWNINRTELTSGYATNALEMICEALPEVLAYPNKLSGRRSMQKAACYAGLAIAETRTALAHAISYPITAKFGVPHGLACSFTLASILDLLDGSNVDIPTSSIIRVKKLLKTLNLEGRLESYVSWDTLIQADFSDLETSRSGNFIYDVDSYLIKSILNDARKRALRN